MVRGMDIHSGYQIIRYYPFLFVAGKLANRYEIINGMGFWYLPLPYTDISHDE